MKRMSESARLFCVFTVVGLASVGCYETNALRIPVRTPSTALGCGELADQVFFDAGYVKLPASTGAMVYTPRGPAGPQRPQTALPFSWGISVWLPHPETRSACDYELQAVSADPSCDLECPPPPASMPSREPMVRPPSCAVIQCPLTPQPGAQYDEATRQMAQRLRSAGADAVSMSRPSDVD